MRVIIALALSSFFLISACTSTPPPAEEIPQAQSASSDCVDDLDWAYSAKRGSVVYFSTCDYCHQDDGRGETGQVPALAGNAALAANPDRGIRMVLVTQGPQARTHGMEYDDMVAILGDLEDKDIADVMNYVLSSWGNCSGPIDAARVRSVAASMK